MLQVTANKHGRKLTEWRTNSGTSTLPCLSQPGTIRAFVRRMRSGFGPTLASQSVREPAPKATLRRSIPSDGSHWVRLPSTSRRFLLTLMMSLSISQLVCCKSNSHGFRTISDATGKQLSIPTDVSRIACSGAINQVVLMLGGADRIVATAAVVQQNEWFVRAYPPIRRVPAPYGVGSPVANVEALIATRPDVVFGTVEGRPIPGIPTVGLALENPDGIKRTIRVVGDVLGRDAPRLAAEFIAYYDGVVSRVRSVSDRLPPERRVRAFTAAGKSNLQTDGRRSIATAWIEAGGGINVAAATIETPSAPVTLELVATWDPEVIFTTQPAGRDAILEDPRWADVSAVKHHRVYASPRGIYLWSVRSAEGALQYLFAAKALHPSDYADIDLVAETRTFYRRFYHMEVTDADIAQILDPAN